MSTHKSKRFSKKAEMGVGLLMMFIASLLVTAMAAAVIIVTSSDLNQKSIEVGKDSHAEISTHVQFYDLSGHDGRDGYLENMTILMRLHAGSEPVDLEESLFSLSLSNDTQSFRYNASTNYSVPSMTAGNYNITYEVRGKEYRHGLLNKGDMVRILLILPRPFVSDEQVRIVYTPKLGTQTVLDFRTPITITKEETPLYPTQ